MINEDIEIGIKIIPNIHITTENDIMSIDVEKIIDIITLEDGCVIYTVDEEYKVLNNPEKIKEAIEDAMYYKYEALNRIKEILK
jgi:hypothetical protein